MLFVRDVTYCMLSSLACPSSLLPDTFRCGTNITGHPTAADPGQLPPSSFHRVHYVLPDQTERCVGQENRSEMGSGRCWWEGGGAGWVQVLLLGSGVLARPPRAPV